jgi:hypothetical protein
MARQKPTDGDKAAETTLAGRVLLFFRVQPFGEPCSIDDLRADLGDDELN